jgi:ferredoxin
MMGRLETSSAIAKLSEMTSPKELSERRALEAKRIRNSLDRKHEARKEETKGGEDTVAFVHANLCIGCDQCDLVCDDDAIEMYDTPLASPLMDIEVNKKAKIIRDACTGCRLCVLACPTDAIVMLDR